MSYVTGTAHYNLPQTVGTDKRDWSDTNKAFADVDAALYSATNDLSDVVSRTGVLEGDNATNKEDIAKNASDITTLEGRVTAVEHVANEANNGIADVRQDAEDMITAYSEKSAQSLHDYEVGQFFIYNSVLYKATQTIKAGDTIIPNTNCVATNVTSQLSTSNIVTVELTGKKDLDIANAIFPTLNSLVVNSQEILKRLQIVLVSGSNSLPVYRKYTLQHADVSGSVNNKPSVYRFEFASIDNDSDLNISISYLSLEDGQTYNPIGRYTIFKPDSSSTGSAALSGAFHDNSTGYSKALIIY